MFNIKTASCEFGGRTLTLETGRLARQANGAVLVSYGETRVLVTVVASKETKDVDFLPLTVEFQEKFYAAGRIPGGFFKREGRPSTDATLSARTIDRPIRPLFPEGWRYETQIVATVLSVDKENDPDVVASIGASAALAISDIPFAHMLASCRIGRVEGQYVANPSMAQLEKSDMEVLISGTKNAIMMVEGGCKEVPEEEVLQGLLFGHKELKKAIACIEDLASQIKPTKRTFEPKAVDKDFKGRVASHVRGPIKEALHIREKALRYAAFDSAIQSALAQFVTADLPEDVATERKKLVKETVEDVKYEEMREMILASGTRIDGRTTKDIRPIAVEAGLLPRAHGSALFTRGETQVLAAVTLGTGEDEQLIDAMRGSYNKKFMLNYNFPPYSVGETGRFGGQGRREIGHGVLAERALENIMPKGNDCPYTVRVVCEVLESNGSSSMGSVCSGSMALMDAGIKLPAPVAGIAMGLIKDNATNRAAILSDILGDEDHLGDMDFKVAGTNKGVTAIQMDIKIEGIDEQIMRTAMQQAREGRLHILKCMEDAISAPRQTVSDFAPRFSTIQIKPDKIRDVIGSGGKVIKDIVARTGCKIDVSDDGLIKIASTDPVKADLALEIIRGIVAEPEVGRIYKGKVKSILDFGAFVEIMPGTDGLLHVSEIAHERVAKVTDYLKEGDELEVKVLELDRGRVRLSRKALLERPAHQPPEGQGGGGRGGRGEGGGRGGRGDGDRGGRGGHGGSGGGRGRDRGGDRDRSSTEAKPSGLERHDTLGTNDSGTSAELN
jgi:polyribonucleotide nucleotidyltransferase